MAKDHLLCSLTAFLEQKDQRISSTFWKWLSLSIRVSLLAYNISKYFFTWMPQNFFKICSSGDMWDYIFSLHRPMLLVYILMVYILGSWPLPYKQELLLQENKYLLARRCNKILQIFVLEKQLKSDIKAIYYLLHVFISEAKKCLTLR